MCEAHEGPLYHYDADDRLEGVSLDYVNPQDVSQRPHYAYHYDERGNQTGIVDPLGRETRFTFTDQGQQESRTLPLSFGTDGISGTPDDRSAKHSAMRKEANCSKICCHLPVLFLANGVVQLKFVDHGVRVTQVGHVRQHVLATIAATVLPVFAGAKKQVSDAVFGK
ncbi:RHS repeat domain-containing protein [Rubripirellula tenax]|uniref:RHS repeat domain-containing protein n=1 Tax=Rubripirellula tenax TaxID=2528015 RepID=UPI001647209A|nr:RHS repeat domain-containing protein [Rubripirellula tenax]